MIWFPAVILACLVYVVVYEVKRRLQIREYRRWLRAAHVRAARTRCTSCQGRGCLGSDVAANRGGCRMQTWADVG